MSLKGQLHEFIYNTQSQQFRLLDQARLRVDNSAHVNGIWPSFTGRHSFTVLYHKVIRRNIKRATMPMLARG